MAPLVGCLRSVRSSGSRDINHVHGGGRSRTQGQRQGTAGWRRQIFPTGAHILQPQAVATLRVGQPMGRNPSGQMGRNSGSQKLVWSGTLLRIHFVWGGGLRRLLPKLARRQTPIRLRVQNTACNMCMHMGRRVPVRWWRV